MKGKPSLYELLGAAQSATVAELQAAYRHQIERLEAGHASPQQQADRRQLLRLALTTLTDPVSRLGYDTRLAAAAEPRATRASGTRSLVPVAEPAGVSADVRAEALALRAEALALRADALLVRAGLDAAPHRPASVAGVVASGALTLTKRVARALGLLVLIGLVAFFTTRLVRGDPAARQAALEAKAHEQTALQEYEQTHGVRPTNLAELEQLEAERQRRRIESWQSSQDQAQREREARRFVEESRERGRQVAADLRAAEEQAQRDAEQDRWRKHQEEQMRQETERQRMLTEQMRVERERQQWREVLAR